MSDFDNIINDRLNEDDGENFPRREMNWDKLSQRLAAFEAANPLNDFDNTINERLNADDGEFFPRREMNWDKLSQRLDDFEVANPLPKVVDLPKPVLTAAWKRWAWTSAAAALMGVSGLLWHLSEVKTLEQRNAELEQKIADINGLPTKSDSVFGKTTAGETKSIEGRTKTTIEQGQGVANSSNKEVESANISQNGAEKVIAQKEAVAGFEQKQENTSGNQQKTTVVDLNASNSTKEKGKTAGAKNTVIQKRNNSQITQMNNKKVQDALPFDKKNVPLNEQKRQLNPSFAQQTPPSVYSGNLDASRANTAQNRQNEGNIAPKEGDNHVDLEKKGLQEVETVAQKTTVPLSSTNRDSSAASEPFVEKKNDVEPPKPIVAEVVTPKVDTAAKTNLATQNEDTKKAENIIIPNNDKKGLKRLKSFLPKGLAIGIERFYGEEMPDVKGIMPTTGNGVSAELMFAHGISLVASGDLLETHFEVGERPRHFHVKDEPSPTKPNIELHRIKGEQRSRLLSLNAKYVFGQKWWAQPSLTVGHSWHKIAGYPVNYVFKDVSTGEETPVAVQVETEKIKSLWQVGVGVQKSIKRWTFGVSAEMQKDFSNPTDPRGQSVASNFGILRGGVKFNIF